MTTGPETALDHKDLNAALLAAQKDLRGFFKDATNSFHDYKYASADAVVAQAREVLHAHGLLLAIVDGPNISVVEATKETSAGKGQPKSALELTCAVVTIKARLVHVATGAFIEIARQNYAEPGSGRPLDKAVLGAETSAISYLLRGLLFVPRTDEDVNLRDDRKYHPEQLGKWVDAWLEPECKRLGIPLPGLKAAMLRQGKNKAIVDQPVFHWPIVWKAEIKAGLAKYAAEKGEELAQDGDDAADLPMRAGSGEPATVKTVTRADAAPASASVTPASPKGKPKGNGASREAVTITPADLPF